MPDIQLITTAHEHWQFEPSSQTDLDEKTYRAIPALNPSALVAGIVDAGNPNPSAVRQSFEGDDVRTMADSDRLIRGQFAHCLLLEGIKEANNRFAVWTGKTRRGAEWDAFENAALRLGKTSIRNEDFYDIAAACEAIGKHPRIAELFHAPRYQREVSLFGQWGSLFLKGRVDAWNPSDTQPRLIDLKTTEAGISDYDCERTARQMKYREKLAFYQFLMAQILGIEPQAIEVYIVFAKLSKPYGLNVKKLTYDCYQFGWSRCEEVLHAVELAVIRNQWPIWISDGFLGLSGFEANDTLLDSITGENHA